LRLRSFGNILSIESVAQAEVSAVKLFKRLFDAPASGPLPEADGGETVSESFAAAIAAIDRAAREHQQQSERRSAEQDRRKGGPDTRPPGSPERRSGLGRRAPHQTQGFGRRGMAV